MRVVVAVAGSVGLLGTGLGTASAQAARYCPGTAHTTLKANSATSCGFARNIALDFERAVRIGRLSPFSDDIARGHSYSPATGRAYTVHCSRGATYSTTVQWSCRAGRGAKVALTYY